MLDQLSSQREYIQGSMNKQEALIRKNSDFRPRLIIRVPLDLSTAATQSNAYHVADPFNGFYVESATDSSATVKLSCTSNEKHNLDNYTTVSLKDAAEAQEPIRGAFLTWDAQAGKTMTLVFYLGLNFKPGSYVTATGGGVSEYYGTAMSPAAAVSVTSTATLVSASSSTAKRRTIQNISGVGIYISGASTVVGAVGGAGTLIGLYIPVGGSYEWLNQDDIYAITDAGTAIVSIQVES